MIKISIPFTDEIVLDSATYADYQRDEVIVNDLDEVREALEMSVKHFRVEDIAVFMVNLKCPESVCVNIQVSNYAWIMNFALSGAINIRPSGKMSSSFNLIENTYYSALPPVNEHLKLVIKGEVKLFVVCLSGDTFKKLLAAENAIKGKKRSSKLFQQRLTPIAMTDIMDKIIKCAENNCLHRILLAAKMLELLYLDIEQINTNSNVFSEVATRPNDRQKLEHAKALIVDNLQAPCSLIELAHKVGLNDFKLKKGFKETFGTTVFGYLADLRMEKAKKMLFSGRYTVNEVAYEVGYKNAHHFTTAFKKKFGQLPSKVGSI